ncbi:hypothetical protein D9M70_648340 [compost metagenome]
MAIVDLRDSHRVLVDENDILDNVGQISRLKAAGYSGPFSFEPFADDVHGLANPAAALKSSMTYVEANI